MTRQSYRDAFHSKATLNGDKTGTRAAKSVPVASGLHKSKVELTIMQVQTSTEVSHAVLRMRRPSRLPIKFQVITCTEIVREKLYIVHSGVFKGMPCPERTDQVMKDAAL